MLHCGVVGSIVVLELMGFNGMEIKICRFIMLLLYALTIFYGTFCKH